MNNNLVFKAALFFVFAALFSCGDSSSTTETGSTDNSNSSETKATTKKLCISNYIKKPSDLLTEAMVQPYAEGELELNELAGNSLTNKMNECAYQWNSGLTRTLNIGEKVMNVPRHYYIRVHQIEVLDLENPIANFKKSYQNISDEERAKLNEALKSKIDESDKPSDAQKELGKDLIGLLGKVLYEEVNGIGDLATWSMVYNKMSLASEGELIVQYGKERFLVGVDLGGKDASKSKAAAIEIAKQLLANCK